jgi:acetylornithine deacetylase/succinyl-diaminopimelate desuccinylase-like protein
VLRGILVPALSNHLRGLLGTAAPTIAPLLHNTATPTAIRGGIATNVIPTELSVDLDGRVLPGSSPTELVTELQELARGLATFELLHEEPAVPIRPDLALIPLLADAVRQRDPGCVPIPVLVPGYTDARYISKLGIQTYGFLPMRLPPEIGIDLLHAADERAPAQAIAFGVDCLMDVIHRYR